MFSFIEVAVIVVSLHRNSTLKKISAFPFWNMDFKSAFHASSILQTPKRSQFWDTLLSHFMMRSFILAHSALGNENGKYTSVKDGWVSNIPLELLQREMTLIDYQWEHNVLYSFENAMAQLFPLLCKKSAHFLNVSSFSRASSYVRHWEKDLDTKTFWRYQQTRQKRRKMTKRNGIWLDTWQYISVMWNPANIQNYVSS